MRYSFSSDDEELMLAPREQPRLPPPSYSIDSSYRLSIPRLSMSKTGPEYVMRDEERYPTPIEEDPGLHPYTSSSPATASTIDTIISPIILSPVSSNDEILQAVDEVASLKVEKPRKNFSLRRRKRFLLVTGIALLLIIGSVVGIVVGLKLRKSSANIRLPALTSSGLYIGTNNTDWNTQISYMNTTSGEVNFKLSSGESNFTVAQTMNLTIIPATDAPMSMVSMLGTDGNIYLNLFYIADTSVILANLSCDSLTCTIISNAAISDKVSFPLYETSGLAALYLGSSLGFRVFYHNSDRYLTQLSSKSDGSWGHGTTISGKAVAGSAIAATEIGTSGMINVLYVEDKSEALYYVQYNATWQVATPVSETTVPEWDALTGFTSCWQPSNDTIFVYFTGSDKLIYAYEATNASDSGKSKLDWSGTLLHDLTWLPSDVEDASIGAIAWEDEVRFHRLVGGKLAQSAMIDGIWSAKYI